MNRTHINIAVYIVYLVALLFLIKNPIGKDLKKNTDRCYCLPCDAG